MEMRVGRRPHHVIPDLESAHVVLAVKSFAQASHIGLGVTALCTMRVLRRHGIHTDVWTVKDVAELKEKLKFEAFTMRPITHVIVSAPSWVQPEDFAQLSTDYSDIEFVQLNHSGTAFLSIDKFGIRNIRAVLDMQHSTHNVRSAFNNPRGHEWAEQAFGHKAVLLPNLYDPEVFARPMPRARRDFDPLRIGSFGASRPWKNQLTAAEAGLQLARRLGVKLEFYVNSGRPERLHGGQRLIDSRTEIFEGQPDAKLIEVYWQTWPEFLKTVRSMDILFSPSFDETFNVVTADGIAMGVPSVVTGSIEWAPRSWWCDPWDPSSACRIAIQLLNDPLAVEEAREALIEHVAKGLRLWKDYLRQNGGLHERH